MQADRAFTLDSKYTQPEGTILLSGTQALIRVLLDQRRADQRRGINTAGMISGYRGSPLAGFDLLLQRSAKLLEEQHIRFVPGVNEDLGATMIFGSQIANLFPQPKYDGVLGMWYGKAPGVDRSGDIFKHANVAGVGRAGGVLAVAGDDPLSRSSTLPSASETAMYDALMPVLVPGNIQEILDYGRLGYELSRYTGLWVGFKLTNLVADQFGTAQVGEQRLTIVQPPFELHGRAWQPTQTHTLGSPTSLVLEREIYEGRLVAAAAFAAANRLNRITVAAPGAWLGIVAAGKTYHELCQALMSLGLDAAALERYGIRLLQLGMIFPLEAEIVRSFAEGLEEIIVVEEKRSFVELFVRDILYHQVARPRVLGKQDEQGQPLLPAHGELDADILGPILAKRLARHLPAGLLEPHLAAARARRAAFVVPLLAGPARTPYFCSGCPHNRSTVVPEGSLAGGGIGCHGLVHGMGRSTIGLGHMGGEGAQWAGIAPFSELGHIFQNLGDGTLFHSGSLAIRQAVSAKTHITYKILYNSAVGMTGGQEVDGAMPVAALTRALEAEGVGRIIVVSEDPTEYPADTRWAPGVDIWHRDRLDEAQLILRDTPGVTVLLYDQMCAAERRRLRKRGKLPDPPTRVFINQAVCEGCGDCGVKSNCLSVHPVETEYGRKTQIHQSSCNKDYSCLMGDCPAFLTVVPDANQPKRQARPLTLDSALPEPTLFAGPVCNVVMMGVGGTGVVTVNQVLGTAALLAGQYVDGLDQTGLSQKGGPVVSHLKISTDPPVGSNRIGAAEADCFLAFDLLTATAGPNLARANPARTVAVISTSQTPTGAMVANANLPFPPIGQVTSAISAQTRAAENVQIEAIDLAETYFGDHLAANMIVLGAAYQRGLLPIGAGMIERAITLNGTAVGMNTAAFRLGRQIVARPAWLAEQAAQAQGHQAVATAMPAALRAAIDAIATTGELRRLLDIRVPELVAYQNEAYAQTYLAFVARVRAAERASVPAQTRLSVAVARYLFKLMAYKDEYEVARLSLRPELAGELREQFGAGAQVAYQLHPPLLRALGWQKKVALGRWFDPVFRLLLALRAVRGTPLDLFGYAQLRRVERALITEYRELIERELAGLTPERYEHVVAVAELPDLIRGYEEVKRASIQRFREQVAALAEA